MNKPLIVWLPLGDRNTPSSRLRSLAVSDWTARENLSRNLFPPFELNEVPSTLFIEKKCDPTTRDIATQLKQHGTRIVYDLCDPIWLQADINRQRQWEPAKVVELADFITVPTTIMAEDLAAQYPTKAKTQIVIIPDRLDLDDPQLAVPAEPTKRDRLRIGWIGTSLNMEHIPLIAEALTALNREHPCGLRLITKSHQGLVTAVPHVPVEYWPWTLDGYHEALQSCDCVAIPMTIRPDTRTKSSNRLQLCLALGLPVIASPVPSYVELMGSSDIVAFANSPGEWQQHLAAMTDFEYRQRCSEQGQTFARANCRFEHVIPLWHKVLLG